LLDSLLQENTICLDHIDKKKKDIINVNRIKCFKPKESHHDSKQ